MKRKGNSWTANLKLEAVDRPVWVYANVLYKHMIKRLSALVVVLLCFQGIVGQVEQRTRLIVLADMGNEPDEMQQMIHMVMCSNEFEPEGLIAVTGKWLQPGMHDKYRWVTHPELFHEIIDAYAKVYPQLQKHAKGWHTPEYLHSIVAAGQAGYGIADVGAGNASEGSKLLVRAFEKDDSRPIWIVVNAGSNTLAQALLDYGRLHSKDALEKLIGKLRVFENGAQDNAGAYICKNYPNIHWIRSNYQTYAYGGPGRIKGSKTNTIGPYFWEDFEYSFDGQNEWLRKHVMNDHGPLGDLYPERRFGNGSLGFMEGGGTIPWLGLVNKGLFHIDKPSWGGWGGRYTAEKQKNIWSRHKSVEVDETQYDPFFAYSDTSDVWYHKAKDTVYNNNYVPIWRWREAMFNNLKCRMDWCEKPYDMANHHPVAVFFDDSSDSIIFKEAKPGETIQLNATKSEDPDEDDLEYLWWIYKEAGNYTGDIAIDQSMKPEAILHIPMDAAGTTIHVVLEVKDTNPIGSLFDYRRIVIQVVKTNR